MEEKQARIEERFLLLFSFLDNPKESGWGGGGGGKTIK